MPCICKHPGCKKTVECGEMYCEEHLILHLQKVQPISRTEEEKLTQAPMVVIFGGKEYEVKPLVIRESRPWRKKVIELIALLPQLTKITMDSPEDFEKALMQFMVTMPDQVIDLFFEYAKDLNRDEIEGVATDFEVAKAFEVVIKVAFPLAESFPKALARLTR